MDEVIIAALADVLKTESRIVAVHETPPESFGDTPAAVILESTGEAGRDSYQGGWSSLVTVRIVLYVTPRTHLPEAVTAARPWVQRLLSLLATNDTLLYQPPRPATPPGGPVPPLPPRVDVAELQTLSWSVGQQQYAKTMYAVVEITATYRADWGVVVSCLEV